MVDPPALPLPPFARCPLCGAYVGVISTLDFEFLAHRRPDEPHALCEYPPPKAKRRDVTRPVDGVISEP